MVNRSTFLPQHWRLVDWHQRHPQLFCKYQAMIEVKHWQRYARDFIRRDEEF